MSKSYGHETYNITSRDIPNVSLANEIFGDDTSLLVARPGRGGCSSTCCGCFFTIPEGFYALVTHHGADIDYSPGNPVWPPGLHFGPPWRRVSHLVTKQSILFTIPVPHCKTRDNVSVTIHVSLLLRVMGDENPENVRKFVHEVTAEGLRQQLSDAGAEAVRVLVRSVNHTEVFGLRSVGTGELEGVRRNLAERLGGGSEVPHRGGETTPMAYMSVLGSESLVGAAAILPLPPEGGDEEKVTEWSVHSTVDMPLSPIMEDPTNGQLRGSSSSTTEGDALHVPMAPPHTDRDQTVVEELLEEKQEETLPAPISPVTTATAMTDVRSPEEKDLEGTHDPLDHDEAQFAVEHGTSVISEMKTRLDRQFRPQGVEIGDVILTRITLPDDILKQMSQKTMVISQNAEQRMQQKYDMLLLQQTEAIKTLKQYQSEQEQELIEDGEYQRLMQNLSLALEEEEGSRSLANIVTQMKVDINTVKAESDMTIQRIQDVSTLDTDKIRLSADFEAAKLTAERFAETSEISSLAHRDATRVSSQADQLLYEACGTSAPKLKTFNDFLTRQKKMEVQRSLAENDKLVIIGKSGGEAANKLLLVDAALDKADKDAEGDVRNRVLTELAMASGRGYVRFRVNEGGSEVRDFTEAAVAGLGD